jgi:hypothetical protein
VEKERQTYIDAGFDAWILKPISFQRLSELMAAIVDPKVREDALYTPGQWERGGWFDVSKHTFNPAKAGHGRGVEGSSQQSLPDSSDESAAEGGKSLSAPQLRNSPPDTDGCESTGSITQLEPVSSPNPIE